VPLSLCFSFTSPPAKDTQNEDLFKGIYWCHGDCMCFLDHKHPMIRWKEERMNKMPTTLHDLEERKGIVSGNMKSCVHSEEDSATSDDDDMPSEYAKDKTSGKVAAHPILVKFEQWMQSPDGGEKYMKTVKQHSAQLLGMLKAFDDSEDIHSLLDLKLVRHVFE
jgi:hypothetical protein